MTEKLAQDVERAVSTTSPDVSTVAKTRFGKYLDAETNGLAGLGDRERALIWKQDLRIVPLCAGIYLLCYLDRSNIGSFDLR
jgi:hypothetical protein